MDASERSWRSLAAAEIRSGWRVLLGCTIGIAAGAAALPFYTMGAFVTPLEHEFGWSRTQMSLAAMTWTLTVVVCAPFVGALIDRFGVRGPSCLGLLALAATFFGFSRLDGNVLFYVAIQIAGAAGGVASTPVAFTRAVNEQFHHARGAALGFTLAGTGITAAFAPGIISEVIASHGWRAGFVALAATAATAAPLVWLLLGSRRRGTAAPASATPAVASLSLREALTSSIFVRLLAAFFVLALGVSGYVMHMIAMMTDAGLSVREAAAIQGALGIAVIAGRVGIGLLVDHFFAPRVAAVALSITALGMIALGAGGTAAAAPAALAIGFALGAEVDLIGYLTARYFGLTAYGRLYGVLYGAFVLGTGLSPVLIASLQERTHTYTLSLYVCAVLVMLAVALFATAPAFAKKPAIDSPTH